MEVQAGMRKDRKACILLTAFKIMPRSCSPSGVDDVSKGRPGTAFPREVLHTDVSMGRRKRRRRGGRWEPDLTKRRKRTLTLCDAPAPPSPTPKPAFHAIVCISTPIASCAPTAYRGALAHPLASYTSQHARNPASPRVIHSPIRPAKARGAAPPVPPKPLNDEMLDRHCTGAATKTANPAPGFPPPSSRLALPPIPPPPRPSSPISSHRRPPRLVNPHHSHAPLDRRHPWNASTPKTLSAHRTSVVVKAPGDTADMDAARPHARSREAVTHPVVKEPDTADCMRVGTGRDPRHPTPPARRTKPTPPSCGRRTDAGMATIARASHSRRSRRARASAAGEYS
ncbi:hypothetical protein R3P38DRAFT_3204428 [Favolaschia claudopus]|uniref:Uncharacterized protein n=1 Tax=Favolaschia claudopus TaxID=2862362 RepID=A0AAW0ASX2_9AGAR